MEEKLRAGVATKFAAKFAATIAVEKTVVEKDEEKPEKEKILVVSQSLVENSQRHFAMMQADASAIVTLT